MKPEILKIGTCKEDEQGGWIISGWHFGHYDGAVLAGQVFMGWTVEELATIAMSQ